jgi:hypothetical protein
MRDLRTVGDSYKMYKHISDEPKDYKTYMNITGKLLKHLMKRVMEGERVSLGELGEVGITCRKVSPTIGDDGKIRGLAPDWKATKQMWKQKAEAMGMTFEEYIAKVPKEERELAYCFNEHSNGLIYNIHWFHGETSFKNRTIYNLRFTKDNKIDLNKMIRDGDADFTEIQALKRVNGKMQKAVPVYKEDLAKKEEKKELW